MTEVVLYDTTLRDGTQGEGISFSVEDKLKIVRRLDRLGIPYIEGGWPGSNPKDMEFFQRVGAILAAGQSLPSAQRRPTSPEDRNLGAVIQSGSRPALCSVVLGLRHQCPLHHPGREPQNDRRVRRS